MEILRPIMISICVASYNRKPQFINTLESITKSTYKDIEVIVTDDASNEDNRLEDLINLYPFLKIVRVEPNQKNWVNPCIAYNKSFKEAKGDLIIIQNPECQHIGDVLQYTADNCKSYNYLSFACLSGSEGYTYSGENITNRASYNGCLGWYNHSAFFPRPYHFCAAITKVNLDTLKGFDERFLNGPCYDDDDLVNRIRFLGLSIKIVDKPFVLHQYHDSAHIFQEDSHQRFLDNQAIYNKIQRGELKKWHQL